MSHITPLLEKPELDSGIEVLYVFFGRLLGLPGRFYWPPQWAIAYFGPLRDSFSPGLLGRHTVRSLPTKDRVPMGKPRSSREVRPISTSQRER